MPFHFAWCGRLPSEWSLLPEHQQSNPVPEDWTHYCIQVRMTLGEGGSDHPQPPHALTGSLIADMFQDGFEEWITGAVVLAHGEVILLFWWHLLKVGLLLGNAWDSGILLRWPSQLGWERGSGKNDGEYCPWRSLSLHRCIVEKRTKAKGARLPPRNGEDKTDPHSSIQHWRVDLRLGGRCFQNGGEKWWSE